MLDIEVRKLQITVIRLNSEYNKTKSDRLARNLERLISNDLNFAYENTKSQGRIQLTKKNSGGFSPPANYTDRATAACRRR
jgi:hypothetical protein